MGVSTVNKGDVSYFESLLSNISKVAGSSDQIQRVFNIVDNLFSLSPGPIGNKLRKDISTFNGVFDAVNITEDLKWLFQSSEGVKERSQKSIAYLSGKIAGIIANVASIANWVQSVGILQLSDVANALGSLKAFGSKTFSSLSDVALASIAYLLEKTAGIIAFVGSNANWLKSVGTTQLSKIANALGPVTALGKKALAYLSNFASGPVNYLSEKLAGVIGILSSKTTWLQSLGVSQLSNVANSFGSVKILGHKALSLISNITLGNVISHSVLACYTFFAIDAITNTDKTTDTSKEEWNALYYSFEVALRVATIAFSSYTLPLTIFGIITNSMGIANFLYNSSN